MKFILGTIIIVSLALCDLFLFMKWQATDEYAKSSYTKSNYESPKFVIRGDKPGMPKEYLDDLTRKAESGNCDAIYVLWEYYSMHIWDNSQAQYWMDYAHSCGCTQNAFALTDQEQALK